MQLHHPEQAKAGQRGDRGQCCTLCLVLHFIALLPFVWGWPPYQALQSLPFAKPYRGMSRNHRSLANIIRILNKSVAIGVISVDHCRNSIWSESRTSAYCCIWCYYFAKIRGGSISTIQQNFYMVLTEATPTQLLLLVIYWCGFIATSLLTEFRGDLLLNFSI